MEKEVRVACISYADNVDYHQIAQCCRETHQYNPHIKFYVCCECNVNQESAISIQGLSEIFSKVAAEIQGYIIIGFLEESNQEYFSTFASYSPRGNLVAHYRGMIRDPPFPAINESVMQKFKDQSLPEWASYGTKQEAFETEYGRVGICSGGLELLRSAPLRTFQYSIKLNFWVGGARFTGLRSLKKIRNEIEHQIEILASKSISSCSLIASCYLPAEGGKAINIIWDFSKKNTTMIDIASLKEGFHVSIGTLSCKNPTFTLPPPLKAEVLSAPPPAGKVRMAGAQMSSNMKENKENAAKMFKMVREAAANHAKFVVFPEAALTGYLCQNLDTNWHLHGRKNNYPNSIDPEPYAIRVVDSPDEILLKFTELSKELDIYIVVPFIEKAYYGDQPLGGTEFDDLVLRKDPDRLVRFYDEKDLLYYNTALLISPSIIHPDKSEPHCRWSHYRKRNPWPFPEISWAEAGQLPPAVTNTPFGKVGLAICFDIHTILEHYKEHKLWTLLYPIAWVDSNPLCLWFHTGLPEFVNSEYPNLNVVGVNWSVDHYQRWLGYGYSYMLEKNNINNCTERFYGDELLFADFDCEN